jgi:hypothetical protein
VQQALGTDVEPKQAFNDLIAAARGHSRESRSLLAQRINEICLMSGRKLSPREAALLFDILEKLILEVELSVRKQLSSTLSEREDTPRDLARLVAQGKFLLVGKIGKARIGPDIGHSRRARTSELRACTPEKREELFVAHFLKGFPSRGFSAAAENALEVEQLFVRPVPH